jgi:hypothetical protein
MTRRTQVSVLADVSEPQPFSLTFDLAGRKITFKGEPVDERDGKILYELAPEGIDGSECDICSSEAVESYCLIKGSLHPRCEEHRKGIAIRFDVVRLPRPPTAMELLMPKGEGISEEEAKALERRRFHKAAIKLQAAGLTIKEISTSLGRQGFKNTAPNTVAKHLRGECACNKQRALPARVAEATD